MITVRHRSVAARFVKFRFATTLAAVLALWAAPAAVAVPAGAPADDTAVLVTGATSGIGLKITELLSSQGQFVYAGARSAEDVEALNEMDNVEAVRLDVTDEDDIAAAVQTIETSGRRLLGVVNNAGVALVGPLIELDVDQLEWLFDVNVYGPYRVTRAFAPLLVEAGGRVVNISSISGILSNNFLGHYSMSKHAIEAYTDALAAELAPLGVHVSAVEPGSYDTNIGETIVDRMEATGFDPETSRFRDRMAFVTAALADRSAYPEPVAVAEAVADALFDEAPRRRYMVVSNRREAEFTIRKAIEELVQLNHGHALSFTRDELVRFLDQALLREKQP